MPPTIRDQMNYKILPRYIESTDTLKIYIKSDTGKNHKFAIKNAVKKVKRFNLYETKEKPPRVLRSDAIREIAKLAESRKQIETFVEYYTGDKKEKVGMIKEIVKHPEFKKNKKNTSSRKENTVWGEDKKRDICLLEMLGNNKSLNKIELETGMAHSTLNRYKKKRIRDNQLKYEILVNKHKEKIKEEEEIGLSKVDKKSKQENLNLNSREKVLRESKCSNCTEFDFNCKIYQDFSCKKFEK